MFCKNNDLTKNTIFIFTLLCFLVAGCSSFKVKNGKSSSKLKNVRVSCSKLYDIKVGKHPWGVDIDKKNMRAFVVSTDENCVYCIDIKNREVLCKISTGIGPWQVCFDEKRNRLYVTNGDDESVSIIDLEKKEEICRVKTGRIPFGIRYCPSQDLIVVTNSDNNNISLINAESLKEEKKIKTGNYPYAVVYNELDNSIVVSNSGEGTLSLIGLGGDNDITERKISVGENPAGLVVDKNTHDIYLASTGKNLVIKVNPKTYTLEFGIPTPSGPIGIALDWENKIACTVHRDKGEMAIFNLNNRTRIKVESVGSEPVDLSVIPSMKLIMVVNHGSNSMSVFKYIVNVEK